MTGARIPLARPDFDQRELEALREVLAGGWVVQGPKVAAFEQALAELHQAAHAVAVSSGTAALHVLYLAMGIGGGDAVFIPSFAWPSAANVAVRCGARPVFVDCLEGTYNIDPADLREKVTACLDAGAFRPRAVVPVHEFGLAADMEGVTAVAREFGLDVIEDAACALGATWAGRKVGTIGAAGVFSFHPRKAVTTGEGGAIVTVDGDLAETCRCYRNHGQAAVDGGRDFVAAGLNYRMTEFQAAIGGVQLGKLAGAIEARRRIASTYLAALAGARGLSLPADHAEHTWQTFMVVLDDAVDRAEIIARLAERGVEAGPGAVAGHCGRFYREAFGYADDHLPLAARLHRQGLAMPLYSRMTTHDTCHCVRSLTDAIAQQDGG